MSECACARACVCVCVCVYVCVFVCVRVCLGGGGDLGKDHDIIKKIHRAQHTVSEGLLEGQPYDPLRAEAQEFVAPSLCVVAAGWGVVRC